VRAEYGDVVITRLLNFFRHWLTYQAHLTRARHAEIDWGGKVTRAKLDWMKQQAREAADRKFPAAR
jgi:hypothetical protein